MGRNNFSVLKRQPLTPLEQFFNEFGGEGGGIAKVVMLRRDTPAHPDGSIADHEVFFPKNELK